MGGTISCWTWNRKEMFYNNAQTAVNSHILAFLRWRKRKKQPGTSWKKALSSFTVIQICQQYRTTLSVIKPSLWPHPEQHSSSSTLAREYTKRIWFYLGWATIYWDNCSWRVRSLSILELIFCHALCDISSVMSTRIHMTKIWLASNLLNGQTYFPYRIGKDFFLIIHLSQRIKQ